MPGMIRVTLFMLIYADILLSFPVQNSGPTGLHLVPLHKYHRSNLTDRFQAVPIPSHSVPVRVVLGSVKKASHWAISTAVGATFTSIQSKEGQKHPKTMSNESSEDF